MLAGTITEIGSADPVKDFMAVLARAERGQQDPTVEISKAFTQMQERVEEFIKGSLGGSHYENAINCIKALRAAGIKYELAQSFNDYMKRLKDMHGPAPIMSGVGAASSSSLPAPRRHMHAAFFDLLSIHVLTPITSLEVSTSRVTEDMAARFFQPDVMQHREIHAPQPVPAPTEEEDLLDSME